MNPIKHHTNNHSLAAPPDWNLDTPCETLGVTVIKEGDAFTLHSFWQPDEEERKLLAQGQPVILTVYGLNHPAVSLGVAA